MHFNKWYMAKIRHKAIATQKVLYFEKHCLKKTLEVMVSKKFNLS